MVGQIVSPSDDTVVGSLLRETNTVGCRENPSVVENGATAVVLSPQFNGDDPGKFMWQGKVTVEDTQLGFSGWFSANTAVCWIAPSRSKNQCEREKEKNLKELHGRKGEEKLLLTFLSFGKVRFIQRSKLVLGSQFMKRFARSYQQTTNIFIDILH